MRERSSLTRRRHSSHGFTLLEVVVVIAILGLLVAVLLPAVQRVRESSRRIKCSSRMRQAWLGMEYYHDAYGNYPTISWHGSYMGNVSEPILIDGRRYYHMLICPSDPKNHKRAVAGSMPVSILPNDGLGTLRPGEMGLFGPRTTPTSRRDFTDGLSNTAVLSERLIWPEYLNYTTVPEQDWNRLVRRTYGVADLRKFSDECQHHALDPNLSQQMHFKYNHLVPPNGNSCTNGTAVHFVTPPAITASSMHPGGVNLHLGDGSGRFVSDSIDREVWWALGTRDGNETLSEF